MVTESVLYRKYDHMIKITIPHRYGHHVLVLRIPPRAPNPLLVY